MRPDAITCSYASLRGSWRRVDRVSAGAKQPQQIRRGHAVEISDTDHQARELAAAGEFVRFGTSDAENPRGGHQVDGGGQAGELADSQRDSVDGILLSEFDWLVGLAVRVADCADSLRDGVAQVDQPDLAA